MIYNQDIEIYRVKPQKVNNPFISTPTIEDLPISIIKGRISRKSTIVSLGDVSKQANGTFRLYCDITEDVIKGDRIRDIDGNNYLVDYVYKPNSHHIEADLTLVRVDT